MALDIHTKEGVHWIYGIDSGDMVIFMSFSPCFTSKAELCLMSIAILTSHCRTSEVDAEID